MITAKINLAKLDKVATMKGKEGQNLLVIDIVKSHLFEGKDGNIYLDLVLFDTPDSQYGDYAIKQSVPKDVREYEKSNNIQRPFLGNAEVFKPKEENNLTEAKDIIDEQSDDLPF